MKKIVFLLMMMCIVFTGCKRDQEDKQNLSIETTSVQVETNADVPDSNQISTITASLAESTDTDTSTNQTSSAEKSSSQTSESAEISGDAGNALQKAMDNEEKAAIDAVQESEEAIYYQNPASDFDAEAYANLDISDFGNEMRSRRNGSNVHQYFFESKSITDVLYLQKVSESYSGMEFHADLVKSSGASLEDSEYLTYQNDSAYIELYQDGTCMMYNKANISGILEQEIPSGMWNPSQGSQSGTIIHSREEWIPSTEQIYPLNGENISVWDICNFLNEYFQKSMEDGWLSSLYRAEAHLPVTVEQIEYENGSYGYYCTIQLTASETGMWVDSAERTAYLNPDRAVQGQCIQVLMLSKDSVDYLYLPPTLTRSPDYQQTLSGTYCTLAEACEILSGYLSSDHVYHVNSVNTCYETVFLGDLGIVQSPMWHFEVTSLTGKEAQYSMLYADIDLETKELYISYQ